MHELPYTGQRHDDVIKWKHFPRYWPSLRGIHRSPVNSPHQGQWPGDLMFSLICALINGWVNNREAGDSRRHRAHYGVAVMDISSYVLYLIFIWRRWKLSRPSAAYTETEMLSFWWNFNHWLHRKLSFWQLSVQPVMKISSKWRHFCFSVCVSKLQHH